MLTLIHFAHLLFAFIWAGGTLLLALAVYPALGRMPAAGAKQAFQAISPFIARVIGTSGFVTALIGPLRGWMSGRITTPSDLTGGYGGMVVAALVLLILSDLLSSRFRATFRALLDDDTDFAALAGAMVRRNAIVQGGLILAILAMMVALGLGQY
jgi:uncharacterized membrane protein